ncbi:hydroxyacid dehydrogenase [Streptomyces tropicalis]|uniref:Hydroxyacid dehydrogenase n=1 Tax=Streptomyces tropicalis TaxID=3034234 RepID=A0ABT6A1L3_9ACTN|nr:hydroxyacid dehydrogenase [Streptomyces tropicalis]MDF3298539.1 hydroxyacid dehydrogenase [Streptomyces tropicalis]
MTTARPPRAVFALDPVHLPLLFPPALTARLRAAASFDPQAVVRDFADPAAVEALAGTEVLITGWGCPRIDADALDAAPRLRAVLHTAGSVRALAGDAVWERGIAVSSAAAANALPVAEYTLAVILLTGKDAFAGRDRYRLGHALPRPAETAALGNAGRRVGVVGASRVGRRLLELLRPHDVEVLLHDPYVDTAEAAALSATGMPLEELLLHSDLVTLHAPHVPATHHLLDRERLALIRDGGVLVNTGRGGLVDQAALTDELVSGRLSAVLDVTDPEPLPAGSPLYTLPNVFLTPHLAGALGNELERLGRATVEELERLAAGRPLAHRVRPEDLSRIA